MQLTRKRRESVERKEKINKTHREDKRKKLYGRARLKIVYPTFVHYTTKVSVIRWTWVHNNNGTAHPESLLAVG